MSTRDNALQRQELKSNEGEFLYELQHSYVSSGMYYYKMKAGGRYTSTKKMILLK